MPKAANIAGQKFGRLTALTPTSERTAGGGRIWTCQCDCGTTTTKSQQALKSGHVKSCGCGRNTRTTGSAARVWQELESWGGVMKTIPEIMDKTKLSWLTVRNALRKFHSDGKVYIADWQTAQTPMWEICKPEEGMKDAPKPRPMPLRERVQRHRVKARQSRAAEKGAAVQVEIATGREVEAAETPDSKTEPEPPAWWESLGD